MLGRVESWMRALGFPPLSLSPGPPGLLDAGLKGSKATPRAAHFYLFRFVAAYLQQRNQTERMRKKKRNPKVHQVGPAEPGMEPGAALVNGFYARAGSSTH